MPSWKKIIQSGSKAHLTQITASDIKFTGTLYQGDSPFTSPAEIGIIDSTDTTIPVANREGVVNNVSTISGISVDTTLARSTDTVDGGPVVSFTVTNPNSLENKEGNLTVD